MKPSHYSALPIMIILAFCVDYTTAAAQSYATLTPFPFNAMPVQFTNVQSGKCMEVAGEATNGGALVQQYTCRGEPHQFFSLSYLGGSDYQIRMGHIGSQNLEVAGASASNDAKLQIDDWGATGAQRFGFVKMSDGSYEIRAKNSNKCLYPTSGNGGSSNANGSSIAQYTCNGAAYQHWFIVHGLWDLSLIAKHSTKCMDVAGASTSDNANVQQFQCVRSAANQGWHIQDAGIVSGTQYYSLVSQNSGKCLDAAGSQDNSNVRQFTCASGDNQKWSIVDDGDGYVTLKGKQSGRCVDVANASQSNNANVQLFSCTAGAQNQRWWFGSFFQRHVQIVQVATSSGANRLIQPDANIQQHVDRANSIYRRYGIELIYDPANDKSNVDNDALYSLGSGSPGQPFTCPDGWHVSSNPNYCATRYAAMNWPDKVVIFSRYGSGYSSGDAGFIVIGQLGSDTPGVCGPTVPNTQWIAHEFGHYMSLSHPFVDFASQAAASTYLSNNQDAQGNFSSSIFDGDWLSDTRPDPFYYGNECLQPFTQFATVTLNGKVGPVYLTVQTDDAMGYYYNQQIQIYPQQAILARAAAFSRNRVRYAGGAGGNPWESLGAPPSGPIQGRPGIVVPGGLGSGTLMVFVRGADNALWSRSYGGGGPDHGWYPWKSAGGSISGSPAAVSWAWNRIDVFARGTYGDLEHASGDGNTAWSWESLGGALPPGGVAAASWGVGRIDVFVRGTNNDLWQKPFYNGNWQDWVPLGFPPSGGLTSGPAAVSWAPDRIDIVARGAANDLVHFFWDHGWGTWDSQGAVIKDEPAIASWGVGRLDVFVQGTDDRLWHLSHDPPNQWNGWEPLGNQISSGPAAVSGSQSTVDVAVGLIGGAVDHAWLVNP